MSVFQSGDILLQFLPLSLAGQLFAQRPTLFDFHIRSSSF